MPTGRVESELLHTYNKVDPFDVLILCVRVAVLTAVTLTVPIVLFPVSGFVGMPSGTATGLWHQALRGETEAAMGLRHRDRVAGNGGAAGVGDRDRLGVRGRAGEEVMGTGRTAGTGAGMSPGSKDGL